jgi:hypothetical protein
MTKLFAALCLLLLYTTKVPAQDSNKNFCRQFGIKLGVNTSQIQFTNTSSPSSQKTTWITGLVVGTFLTVPITGKLSFQPEYLYSQMGGIISPDTTYKLAYLSLPVLLKYNIYKSISLLGGATFDLLLRAKEKIKTSTTITEQLEERNLGVTAGVELKLLPTVGVMARYMAGLNDVDQAVRHRQFRNQGIQLTAFVSW